MLCWILNDKAAGTAKVPFPPQRFIRVYGLGSEGTTEPPLCRLCQHTELSPVLFCLLLFILCLCVLDPFLQIRLSPMKQPLLNKTHKLPVSNRFFEKFSKEQKTHPTLSWGVSYISVAQLGFSAVGCIRKTFTNRSQKPQTGGSSHLS